MAYLTVCVIRNDHLYRLDGHEFEFCKALKFSISSGGPGQVFGQVVKVNKTSGPLDEGVYLCWGNEVYDLSSGSEEAENLASQRPEVLRKMIQSLRGQIVRLEEMVKEVEIDFYQKQRSLL